VFQQGRIVGTYVSGFDDETRSRLIDQFGRLVEWLSVNRPDALDRLLPEGRFRYDAASALLWLEVLEEWSNAVPEEVP
jgi:hypothetical protein